MEVLARAVYIPENERDPVMYAHVLIRNNQPEDWGWPWLDRIILLDNAGRALAQTTRAVSGFRTPPGDLSCMRVDIADPPEGTVDFDWEGTVYAETKYVEESIKIDSSAARFDGSLGRYIHELKAQYTGRFRADPLHINTIHYDRQAKFSGCSYFYEYGLLPLDHFESLEYLDYMARGTSSERSYLVIHEE